MLCMAVKNSTLSFSLWIYLICMINKVKTKIIIAFVCPFSLVYDDTPWYSKCYTSNKFSVLLPISVVFR